MINLLLPEDRQSLKKEYRCRRLTVLGSAFLLVLFVSLVALGSIYYLVFLGERSVRRNVAEAAAGAEAAAAASAIEAIKIANQRAELLNRDRLEPSGLIASLVLDASSGAITIEKFNFESESKRAIKLVGTAGTRADFLAFLAVLRNEEMFAEVDSPVENLISERNLNFTINLSLK